MSFDTVEKYYTMHDNDLFMMLPEMKEFEVPEDFWRQSYRNSLNELDYENLDPSCLTKQIEKSMNRLKYDHLLK